jgi:hypothetical protein
MFLNIFDNKVSHLIIASLYSYLFYRGYLDFLYPTFEYMGYEIIKNRVNDDFLFFLSLIISIIPIIFFKGINQISSFLCVFIYYILYVPIIITYFFDLEGSNLYLIYQQLLFMAGMILLILADRIKIKKSIVINSNINIFKILFIITIIVVFYIVLFYNKNLKFVSFEDVYEQRASNQDFGKSNLLGYFFAWLSNALIPLLLAYGLFSKKLFFFMIGTLASVIVYMSTAAKSVLTFPIVIFVIYFSLKRKNLNLSLPFIGVIFSFIFIIIINLEFNVLSSLFMMRTVGNGGSLTKHYHDFFIDNPKTYYSHINIINYFTRSYPYNEDALGQVVGKEYWSDDMNANANFWATDGIAALGDFGILFSSFLLFIIFIIFNNISRNYNKLFLILILIPYLFSILNTSLFSSILTGGAFIVFFFLSFKSIKNNNYINENSYNIRS